jgi:hypothetical protein
MQLDNILGVRGSDDGEVVSLSSLKKRPQPRLASNFSSVMSSQFIDYSSKETSSSVSSSITSSG